MQVTGRGALKLLLSVFLLYHLAAVIVLPNSSSLMGRRIGWAFLGYANPLLLNRTWQFFSPGPMPSSYLEYEVETADNGTDDVRESHRWPKLNQNSFNNDFYLRTMAGMRFLAANETNFENYFIPYLCKLHPGAIALDLRSVVEQVPAIERAGEYQDFKDMQERLDLPSRRYDCPGAPQQNLIDVAPQEEEGE
jgi:hypothetical protein